MDAIFKKLNYKEHSRVFILNAPFSFEENVNSVADRAAVFRAVSEGDEVEFFIAFATQQSEINDIATHVIPQLKGDAVVWLCYPKGTSKKYKCDFNRDTGWAVLGQYNMEPVRAVAIDEDWSALRFRKVEFIKTMTRNDKMTLSEAGKEKANKKE
jgi:hypothetical protein